MREAGRLSWLQQSHVIQILFAVHLAKVGISPSEAGSSEQQNFCGGPRGVSMLRSLLSPQSGQVLPPVGLVPMFGQ